MSGDGNVVMPLHGGVTGLLDLNGISKKSSEIPCTFSKLILSIWGESLFESFLRRSFKKREKWSA